MGYGINQTGRNSNANLTPEEIKARQERMEAYEREKRKKQRIFIGIAVVVVLFLIILFIVFVAKKY